MRFFSPLITNHKYFGLLLLSLSGLTAQAAEQLEEVVITSTRIENYGLELPASVSLISRDDIQLGRQSLGLDESLGRVPGVFFQDRYNFAQDLRIAIRGFGSRAAFGIRGIKLFEDGIPLTLADGQSGVDDIDLGSTDRIEVIRGPSSSLYGSASGGIISLFSEDGGGSPFLEANVGLGEYNQRKYQLKAGGSLGKLDYMLNGSHLLLDGYRDLSEVEHTMLNSKFGYALDDSSSLTVLFNLVDSPLANDPGGLTLAQVNADPVQAHSRNISSGAGESIDQRRFGLVYKKALTEEHSITLRNYYLWRDFQNFLPIGSHIPNVEHDGVVEFDRFFYGAGAQYNYDGALAGFATRFTAGFDVDIQSDDRQRYINNAGVRGALSFDQLEEAEALGFYFRNELDLTGRLMLTAGGRYDIVDLSVADRTLSNGDQSSELSFEEFSPTVGLSFNVYPGLYLYGNYASSFETPTFTELANPTRSLNVNLGGFSNVAAQTADSFEIGAKGSVFEDRVYFDLAFYTMQVDDEITNISNQGSRGFFENADTSRDGFEATVVADLIDGLRWTGAYTYSDFEFDRFQTTPTFVGNELPGLPDQQFYTELSYTHPSGVYIVWDALYVDDMFVNNANSEQTAEYAVANLRAGYRHTLGDFEISPYVGLNNMFDEDYFGNIRINAVGNRYYEAAPDMNVFGGLTIRHTFQ
jgi:iron complex outermembrane receptor protein